MPLFSIQEQLNRVNPTDLPKILSELDGLTQALKAEQCLLRDDSKLAWTYVTGKVPYMSRANVVFELLLMRFLYEYTPYPLIVSDLIMKQEKSTTTQTASFLQDWVLPLAKIQTLKLSGIPSIWPWKMMPNGEA